MTIAKILILKIYFKGGMTKGITVFSYFRVTDWTKEILQKHSINGLLYASILWLKCNKLRLNWIWK